MEIIHLLKKFKFEIKTENKEELEKNLMYSYAFATFFLVLSVISFNFRFYDVSAIFSSAFLIFSTFSIYFIEKVIKFYTKRKFAHVFVDLMLISLIFLFLNQLLFVFNIQKTIYGLISFIISILFLLLWGDFIEKINKKGFINLDTIFEILGFLPVLNSYFSNIPNGKYIEIGIVLFILYIAFKFMEQIIKILIIIFIVVIFLSFLGVSLPVP